MNKIKTAQELTDKLLDECSCNVVGDDKGALPDVPEKVEDSMDDLEDYVMMDEASKQPTGYDKFKMLRGIGRKEYQKEQRAKKKGSIKESDQVSIAQQLDTLFDKPERMTKDKTDKETSLDPVPSTEAKSFDVAKYSRDAQLASLSKKGEIPVIDATSRTRTENIKSQITELFGMSAEEREKAKKQVAAGTYSGSNPVLLAQSKRNKMMNG